jgi:peptidoglycan/LPS O-acetylase OafA/YrhL
MTEASVGRQATGSAVPSHIPSLDGMRAVSVLAVVVGHLAGTAGAPDLLRPLDHLGYIGVRVFFVISGYLITYLLLTEKAATSSISLYGFYARRAIRILPAFYLYLAVVIVFALGGAVQLGGMEVLAAATFVINYLDERSWVLNHIWSLSVEEQFYLFWPCVVLMLSRKGLALAAVLVLIASPLVRAVMWYGLDLSDTAMTRHFQAAVDALVIGACLIIHQDAILSAPRCNAFVRSWRAPAFGAALIAAASATFFKSPPLFYVLAQSIINIGIAVVLIHVVTIRHGWIHWLLNWRPVAFVGAFSYSIYLWQELFLNPFSGYWFAAFPQNLLLTFACALASYGLVERPLVKFRAKYRRT